MSTVKRFLSIALTTTLFLSVLPLQMVQAADEEGSITIEQLNTEFLGVKRVGSWGLATPFGAIDGDSEKIELKKKPMGNYALTVKPPSGAVSKIEVYQDDVLTETFEARTANGKLISSGGTLKFTIKYSFSQIGDVSVTSKPSKIPYTLKGPVETFEGLTPGHYPNRVAGFYVVYYKLPKPCKPVLPIARKLEAGGRLGFSSEFACKSLKEDKEPPKPEPEPEPEPEDKKPPRRTQSPVRVSLGTASAEVTAGGSARYNIVVLNRGDDELKDLTVEYRYDSAKLTIQGARDASRSPNTLRWTIASLPSSGKWETTFTGAVSDAAANGDTVLASATVSGDDLAGVRSSQRSDSAQFGVIKELPQTGAAMELFALVALVVTSFFSLALSGVKEVVFAR